MKILENSLFNEIKLGQTASLTRSVSTKAVEMFAKATEDMNPLHLDSSFAKTTRFKKRVAHGFFSAALLSALMGTIFPGPGTIYLEQTLVFIRPVFINDKITAVVTVIKKYARKKMIVLECKCVNQLGKTVISGRAKVLAPESKIYYKRKRTGEIIVKNFINGS